MGGEQFDFLRCVFEIRRILVHVNGFTSLE